MEIFAPYAHALAALALFAVWGTVLIGLSTRGRTPEARAACGKPIRDYSNGWYRAERALANSVENSGPIIGAIVAAILVGASPFWVNLLASVIVVFRIATGVVHVFTTNQAMRSATFAVTFLATLALGLMALVGAFTL